MESKEFLWVICVSFCLSCVKGGQDNLHESRNYLDSFIHDSALNRTGRIHSGILYDIPLPSNFSGISASFVRIRSSRLWSKGTNFSSFYIPPRTLSWPFSKRIRIVYKNLGNWSSTYYNVPNYTLLTPVIGFLAYDATDVTSNDSGVVEIRPTNDPISIVFQNASLQRHANTTDNVQCVQFNTYGEFEFSNVNDVTMGYSCIARRHGHFGIVIPSLPNNIIPIPTRKKKSKQKLWKWWVIGFVVGFCALVLLIGLGILLYKCCKRKRIGRMEKESGRSEALESVWVGTSRMPKANATRTQPIVEDSYVPS